MDEVIVAEPIVTKKVKEFKVVTKSNSSILFKQENGKMEFETEENINTFKNSLSKLVEQHFGQVKKIIVF